LLQGFGSLWGDPLLITDPAEGTNNGAAAEEEEEDDMDDDGADANGVVTVDYVEDSDEEHDDGAVVDDDGGVTAYPHGVFYDGDEKEDSGQNTTNGGGEENNDEDEEEDDNDDEIEGEPAQSRAGKKKILSDDLAMTCLMRCKLCGQETIPKSFHKHLEMRHQMTKAEYGPLTYVRKTFHRCHLCGAIMNFTRDSIGGHCRKVRGSFKLTSFPLYLPRCPYFKNNFS
jgi:hypothetical protein